MATTKKNNKYDVLIHRNIEAVVLHDIRSSLNVGAILRTAECAGINKVYLSGYTATPRSSLRAKHQIEKTALGAEYLVVWEKVKRISSLLLKLRKEGYQIVALETGGENLFNFQSKKPGKLALIFGNEVRGLSGKILNASDKVLSIPQVGQKESLNVAVAFGISVYYFRYFDTL